MADGKSRPASTIQPMFRESGAGEKRRAPITPGEEMLVRVGRGDGRTNVMVGEEQTVGAGAADYVVGDGAGARGAIVYLVYTSCVSWGLWCLVGVV